MPSAAAVAYAALKRQLKASSESAMERATTAALTRSTDASAAWRASVDTAKAVHRVESRATVNGWPDTTRRAAAGPALRAALDRARTTRATAEAAATSELGGAGAAFAAAQGRIATALDAAIASIPA